MKISTALLITVGITLIVCFFEFIASLTQSEELRLAYNNVFKEWWSQQNKNVWAKLLLFSIFFFLLLLLRESKLIEVVTAALMGFMCLLGMVGIGLLNTWSFYRLVRQRIPNYSKIILMIRCMAQVFPQAAVALNLFLILFLAQAW
jgi:hypothetical protein